MADIASSNQTWPKFVLQPSLKEATKLSNPGIRNALNKKMFNVTGAMTTNTRAGLPFLLKVKRIRSLSPCKLTSEKERNTLFP